MNNEQKMHIFDLGLCTVVLLVLLCIFTILALKGITSEIGFIKEMFLFLGGAFAGLLRGSSRGSTEVRTESGDNVINK